MDEGEVIIICIVCCVWFQVHILAAGALCQQLAVVDVCVLLCDVVCNIA